MQDQDLAQQIEELIEINDMEAELEPQNQDINLLPNTQLVTIQSLPPLVVESAISEEVENFPLDDDSIMDIYNFLYDELQKNIVHVCKIHCLDDLASPTFIRERVIMADTRRNTKVIPSANFAFVGVTN